jgi:hypothetical protein
MVRKWGCPICEQTSSRNWNMRRHIERKHNRLGQPVDLLKLNEYQYRSRRNGILSEEQISMQSGGFQHPLFLLFTTIANYTHILIIKFEDKTKRKQHFQQIPQKESSCNP